MVNATEESKVVIGLDQALQTMRLDMADAKHQTQFYDIFLNTNFYVPSLDPQELKEETAVEEGEVLPLIIEAEGNDYLMIFDTEERLKNWAAEDVKWVEVPGYVLAATTMPPLHWALNVGTAHSKQFLPEEIAWLREVVERCDEAAKAQEEPNP